MTNKAPQQESGSNHEQGAAKIVNPISLLCPQRFDLIAKYIYGKYYELGVDTDWPERLYSEHIRVFNGFFEKNPSLSPDWQGPPPTKYGIDSFLSSYHELLVSIKNSGFDSHKGAVPIGGKGILLDGAHRVAACLVHNQELPVVVWPEYQRKSEPVYDFQFFQKCGLSNDWCDAVALEYCRLNTNTFIVIIYPAAQGRDREIAATLSKYGEIFYMKSIRLKNQGPINLIRQIYHDERWLGSWKDGYSGAKNKAFPCFQGNGPLRVFVVESDPDRMLEAKNEIRDLFQIANHSIHINDTHDETRHLAEIFFNNNSIHFLNYARVHNYRWFYQLFSEYKKCLRNKMVDRDYFCVDGSAVLAAYGIREARDFDFLHFEYDDFDTGYKEIGSHNKDVHHHVTSRDDIIFNPGNHFYFDGIKFAALHIVRGMKMKRAEKKDHEDIKLIDQFLDENKDRKRTRNMRQFLSWHSIYSRTRFMALKMRFFIMKAYYSYIRRNR